MTKTLCCCGSGTIKYKVNCEIRVQSLDGNLDYYLPNPDVETQYYCQKCMKKWYGYKI